MTCSINSLPYEILSSILQEVVSLNTRDAATYTYGLSQAPEPLYDVPVVQKVIRGRVSPDVLRWRAADSLRQVCPQWHDWAADYALGELYIRRWRGSERWLESRNLAVVQKPSLFSVYRDPFFDLKETLRLFTRYPHLALNVRRLWFGGFHVSETGAYIFEILGHCKNLRSVTLPSVALRFGAVEDWSHLLGCGPGFHGVSSLELLGVDLKDSQRSSATNRTDHKALDFRAVNFSFLTRLKIFGDTNFLPVTDEDLRKIARTATNLRELHVTGMSTVSIDGVMALVKASMDHLRVLEYSPLSKDGFEHPESSSVESEEHLCSILTSCSRLENLSISLPTICSDLFTNESVRWQGEVQVRAEKLCRSHKNLALSVDAQDEFWRMLDQARKLMNSRLADGVDLHVEVFISHWIFEPRQTVVHGNFELGEVMSDFTWPVSKRISGKGPYGQTGIYGPGKDEGPYSYISEHAFRDGLQRSYISF